MILREFTAIPLPRNELLFMFTRSENLFLTRPFKFHHATLVELFVQPLRIPSSLDFSEYLIVIKLLAVLYSVTEVPTSFKNKQ